MNITQEEKYVINVTQEEKCNQGEKPYVKTQITIGEEKNLRTANTNIVEGEKLSNLKYHYL